MRYSSLLPFVSAVLAAPFESSAAPAGLNEIPAGAFIEKHIDASTKTPGATVTTLKYGPYNVPANGMIENSKLPAAVASPCSNCYITAMEADMKYADGSVANIDTGAWLHHMVLYNSLGIMGKKDIICTGSMEAVRAGVPTAIFGYPHRIFASGNERGAVRLNGKGKYGLPMDFGDGIFILYDLVNESNKPATYYIHMKYEHVPQSTVGYKRVEMAWMDITGCGNSDAPAQEGYFELKGPKWTSKIGGRLVATIGHTHDGGDFTTVYVNDRPVCRSDQFYNTKPGYISPEGMGSNSMSGMAGMKMGSKAKRHGGGGNEFHITDVTSCVDFGTIRVGDTIHVGATYNTTKHGLQKAMEAGKTGWADIMGINPVYIGAE